jgi:hypothetical protein
MSHCVESVLRRYLDEPAAVSDVERAHLSECPRCTQELSRFREDRDAVGRALDDVSASDQPSQRDVDRAWAALQTRLAEPDRSNVPARGLAETDRQWAGTGRRTGIASRLLRRRSVTAAVTAGVVVLGGTAAAAAADWLPIFRTEKVTPVAISAKDMSSIDQMGQLANLAGLAEYGDVEAPPGDAPVEVPDAATAAARTGLVVPKVSPLPTGAQGAPSYLVIDQQTARFTFSASKAAAAAAKAGKTLPPIPAGLDGARLQVQAGPGVALVWQQRSGVPALVVGRMKAPTAAAQGTSLPVARDYLLSLPGLSPQLASQLRTVTGDGTTLPIPVPADLANSSQTDVGGAPATLVEAKDRTAVAVIWVRGGEVNAVLGPLSRSEVLAVARGLR